MRQTTAAVAVDLLESCRDDLVGGRGGLKIAENGGQQAETVEFEEFDVRGGRTRGCSWRIAEQGNLAERVARAECAKLHPRVDHVDLSVRDDVKRVAWRSLLDHGLAGSERQRSQPAGETLERRHRKRSEHRECGQKLERAFRHA